jgi:ribosomal protein S18 acetylase RimI-like enzyme
MFKVDIRDLRPEELEFGAGVAARGLRDNPMGVAVLGDDPRDRERYMQRSFSAVMRVMKQPPIAAWRGNYVVGVAGMAPPGTCQLSQFEMLRMFPRVRPRPKIMRRSVKWLSEWERRDPSESHWHVGPVAVEGGLQGMGIGSQLMEAFTARMDASRALAYLETDKPENVVFYERFGFEVVEEAEVLDTPNWFMRRSPKK